MSEFENGVLVGAAAMLFVVITAILASRVHQRVRRERAAEEMIVRLLQRSR